MFELDALDPEELLSPLHVAALAGHVGTVQLLLANKADVAATDARGATPLYRVVTSRALARDDDDDAAALGVLVRTLVRAGSVAALERPPDAAVLGGGGADNPPLHAAARLNLTRSVEASHLPIMPPHSLAHSLAHAPQTRVTCFDRRQQVLLSVGANVNAPRARDGLAPLHLACACGAADSPRLSSSAVVGDGGGGEPDGADAARGDKQEDDREEPEGDGPEAELVRVLLDAGARPNARHGDGWATTLSAGGAAAAAALSVSPPLPSAPAKGSETPTVPQEGRSAIEFVLDLPPPRSSSSSPSPSSPPPPPAVGAGGGGGGAVPPELPSAVAARDAMEALQTRLPVALELVRHGARVSDSLERRLAARLFDGANGGVVSAITQTLRAATLQWGTKAAPEGWLDVAADLEPPTPKARWVPNNASTRCMACAATFSTVKTRRHHCRACGALVCDSCSLKRLLLAAVGGGSIASGPEGGGGGGARTIGSGSTVGGSGKPPAADRVCDACFNRYASAALSKQRALTAASSSCRSANVAAVPASGSDSAAAARELLLGRRVGGGDDAGAEEGASSLAAGAAGALSAADEARRGFLERGERLEQLNDKTEQLANDADEFRSLAAQLRKKEESRARRWGL